MTDQVDETGLLKRDGAGFVLRRDAGGRYDLQLSRTPVDLVEKRVRVVGVRIGPDLVSVDAIGPG